jgi:hypothetical protein
MGAKSESKQIRSFMSLPSFPSLHIRVIRGKNLKLMKTRIGKIARLPHHIREELNQRLSNGIIGKEILTWLNELPETNKIMAELFGGRKITHQNLSEWRLDAYAEWVNNRTGAAQWQDLLGHLEQLNEKRTGENGAAITNQLGSLVVYELGQALDHLHKMGDSAERWRIFNMLSRTFSRLRMDDCREKSIRLRDAKTARRKGQFKAIPTDANHKK